MLKYWKFYWPLALTGAGLVLSIQFQNATLARYPEAVTELAVLALAYGVFGFCNAILGFVAQLVNVFARSEQALKKTHRFVAYASIVAVTPLLIMAFTPIGDWVLASTFNIDTALVERVRQYLVLMCPLILLNGQRHFYTGLLVQAQLTGWITILNLAYSSVVIISLLAGFAFGLKPAYVVVGSELLGDIVLLAGLVTAKAKLYRLPEAVDHTDVTYLVLTRFFIPVSTTGIMFALSRPVLFAFVARSDEGLLAIAALRVAFDFGAIFQQATNQFRHFFITFGFEDLRRKLIFMWLIGTGLTCTMLVFVVTPLSSWLWQDVMGLPQGLSSLAREVLLVMCLMPALIMYRNYFHGRLMAGHRTAGMAYGSTLRVASIYALAWLSSKAAVLDHIGAALILIIGFFVEAAVAQLSSHRMKAADLEQMSRRRAQQ